MLICVAKAGRNCNPCSFHLHRREKRAPHWTNSASNKKKRLEDKPHKYPIIPFKAYENFKNPLTHHVHFPPPSEAQRKAYMSKHKHAGRATDYSFSVSPHKTFKLRPVQTKEGKVIALN